MFNADQGSQFHQRGHPDAAGTPGEDQHGWEGTLRDNIFVERLWRTVKYEEVFLKAYANASEARRELGSYFRFCNNQRPHQALGHQTQAEVFHRGGNTRRRNRRQGKVHRNRCWYH